MAQAEILYKVLDEISPAPQVPYRHLHILPFITYISSNPFPKSRICHYYPRIEIYLSPSFIYFLFVYGIKMIIA
jgi:hypothetical protein